MDPKNGLAPLFGAQLELREPDMIYVPSLKLDDPKGFNAILTELIEDILTMASLMDRISKDSTVTYEEEVKANIDIRDMIKELLNSVIQVFYICILK